jgi:hypothetical protein
VRNQRARIRSRNELLEERLEAEAIQEVVDDEERADSLRAELERGGEG